MTTYHGKLACLAAAISSMLASGAWAQQAGDSNTASARKKDEIETVTVTAQKRKEDANKVPLAISVMKGEDLTAQHITDISDVTRSVPNVSFSGASGSGPGLSNVEIRGVSSSAGSSTVGIYLDDISLTTRNLYSLGSAEPKLFDLDRIEVLRGPQGTLYGASSMGGTLKFITNQPRLDEKEASVYSEVSSTKGGGTNYTVNGVYNMPLVKDELALRVGIQQSHDSGYVNLVSPVSGAVIDSGINKVDTSVVRAALKWTPSRDLSITPAVFYQNVDAKDIDAFYLNLPGNSTSKSVREPGVDRLVVPSVTVNYDLGRADLVSVTSYFMRDFNRTQDGTVVNSQYLGSLISDPNLSATVSNLPSAVYLNNQIRQFSQELRLASKPYDASQPQAITWIGGVYYSDLKTTVVDNEPVFGINKAVTGAGYNIVDIYGSSFPNDNSYFSARHYHTEQQALFGEATYHFSPTLSATVGARYLRASDSLARNGDFFFAGGAPTSSYASSNFNATTPKFSLSWQVSADTNLYATAAQGFRLGGQNRAIPADVCASDFKNLGISAAPTSFDPDKLWSYEVGSKSRLLGNRVNLSLAAFYIDWNKLQQDISLPGCGFDYETNVGSAKSYGVEGELKFKPASNLLIGLSGGYTQAKLTSDVPSLGASSGDPIQGVPKYNASLTAQYNFDIKDDVYGFARAAVHWVGASHGTLVKTDPDYQRPSYNSVDASVGATFGNWELALFAKNLLNNDVVTQRPNVQSVSEGYRMRPRTIGLSLSGKM